MNNRPKTDPAAVKRLNDIVEKAFAGCKHETIVESAQFSDGSTWGKCVSCGEDGFPIRDVGYERFLEARAKGVDVEEAMALWSCDTINKLKTIVPPQA